ncbi:Cysteine-rich receptor-like protein kinase 25 [Bienertia sinuspersici]
MERYTNLLIICLISLYFIKPCYSQFQFISEYCIDTNGNYTANSTYHNNLKFMLSSLTAQANLSLFNNDTVGEGFDQTYGLFMCRGDLSVTQCHDCVVEASTTILKKCPTEQEAVVWFNQCMVRYANYYIFSLFKEAPMVYAWSSQNVSDPETFGEIYSKAVDDLIMQSAYNTSSLGYATGQANVTLGVNVKDV